MSFLALLPRDVDEPWGGVVNTAFLSWEFRTRVAPVNAQSRIDEHALRWQQLFTDAQRGDQRAYETFLREASSFIRVIARRYHRDSGAAEDVVQDTLLTLHRVRHTYEPGRPVEPWVAAIAKARAIDALRARMRRARLETELPADAAEFVADDRHPNQQHEAGAEIAAALAQLPPGQQAAVRMLKLEELSLAEASRVSGLSLPALKSLMHRAMVTLRETMKRGGDA